MPDAVCVFTGSSRGSSPKYEAAARDFGQAIAMRGLILVYGGAGIGCMGALADGALEAGGKVIGVLPNFLADEELAHPNLTELHHVGSMHERKLMMHKLADCFAVLPGGLGTLEETFEAWTWRQLKFHQKPIGFLDIDGYFHHLFAFLTSAATEGFVSSEHLGLAILSSEPGDLLDRLGAAKQSSEGR